MMMATATAVSAALTPMENNVKKKPSSSPGKRIRLNTAKFMSTALRTSSMEMSMAIRLRLVTKPKTPMKNSNVLRIRKNSTGIVMLLVLS